MHMYSRLKIVFVIFVFSLIMFSVSALPTISTWYGPPGGAGSDGGACGYGFDVETIYNKYITAAGNIIFGGGRGCGACYEVKCFSNSACSGQPIKVVVTDQCPGCSPNQFDLSGTAFGALAKPGMDNQLRANAKIQVDYQRVSCQYGGKIKFVVDKGSTADYLAVNIGEVGGMGDVPKVEIQQGSGPYLVAHEVFGATWGVNSHVPGPLSIRLTTSDGKSLTAINVIPVGWQPGATYTSNVQF